MAVGVIGLGLLGGAMYRGFKAVQDEVLGYDIDPVRSPNTLEETLGQNVVLISLPTPVDADGYCDLSAIHSVFDHADRLKVGGSLVLRSTVPIGTTDMLIKKHPNLKIGISPEFLRSHTADFDFLHPSMTIYGGREAEPYFDVIKRTCKGSNHPTIVLSPSEAETVKLLLNGFAAVKAVFSSEMGQLAKNTQVDWDKVVAVAQLDGRLGDGYLAATGPDHLPGLGGTCLPKDSRMLARQLGTDCLLETVLRLNNRLRAQAGW